MRFSFMNEAMSKRENVSLDAKRNGQCYIYPSEYFWKTGTRNVLCPKNDTLEIVLRQTNSEVSEEQFGVQWRMFLPYLKDPGLALMMRDFGMESRYFVPFCLAGMLDKDAPDEAQEKLPWLVGTGVVNARMATLGMVYDMNGDLNVASTSDPFFRWIYQAPTAIWMRKSGEMVADLLERRNHRYHVYYGHEALMGLAIAVGAAASDTRLSREMLAQMIRTVLSDMVDSNETFVFDVVFDQWCNRLVKIAFGQGGEYCQLFMGPQDLTGFLESTLRNFATTYEIWVDSATPPVGAVVLIDKL